MTSIFIDWADVERAVCQTEITTFSEAKINNDVTRRYPVGKTWTCCELEYLPDGSLSEVEVMYCVTGYKQHEAWNRQRYCNVFYPTTEIVSKRKLKGAR